MAVCRYFIGIRYRYTKTYTIQIPYVDTRYMQITYFALFFLQCFEVASGSGKVLLCVEKLK